MNVRSYICCKPDHPGSYGIAGLAKLLKTIAVDNRLRILCILRRGSHCVCEMESHLHLSQSLVSHHLQELKAGGYIKDNKQKLRVYYDLTEYGRQVTDALFKIKERNNL